ncbi:MAG TPA: ABC transporter permease [Candidatus Acidoferrales bacterium]
MGNLGGEFRQVMRRLMRAPMFTAITLITLAAGIGANAVVFSVVNGILLKPLPYPDPDRLIGVWLTAPKVGIKELNMSPTCYFIFREQSQSFVDIGLYTGDSLSVTGIAEPEQVRAVDVTDGTLPLLGITPMLGRTISHDDDLPEKPPTVLLTYGYWKHKFGGSPAAIGKTITLDGKPTEIIGVLPKNFEMMGNDDVQLVIPFQFDRAKRVLGNFSFQGVARLRPGVTMAQASADITRMLPIVNRSFPPPPGFSAQLFEDAQFTPNLRPLKQDVVGDIGKVLWVLMGSIGLVLLIACANAANLLLVRVEGRRHELSVRAALGAGRRQIVGDLLFESMLLGLAGSALGLGIAYAALRILVAMAPTGLPRLNEIGIDWRVLLFTLGISVLASLLVACVPIFKYAGARLNANLRQGGRALSASREQHRARNVLVVVQVALALVLLICSGLMIRTFRALTHVNPGFAHASELQTFRISIPEAAVKEPERVIRMEQEIEAKIAAIPGVQSVAMGTSIPMDGQNSFDLVYIEGHDYAPGEIPPVRRFKYMSPGFLQTMGISLVAGRDVNWDDLYQKHDVTLVSEDFAREYWGNANAALGHRVRSNTNEPYREIVGVVGAVRDDGVDQKAASSMYWPMYMDKFEGDEPMVRRSPGYVIRSRRAGSEAFLKEVRQAVWSVNGSLPLAQEHTEEYFYTRSMARTSFTLVMLAVAGGMALLLGVVGIYGVIAYSVAQRTREIGIRMALGAQQASLTKMFVRHGVILAGIGVVCGMVAAVPLMSLMSSLLFQVKPVDPVTYLVVACGLVATAFLASYLPSRRAAEVNPVEALRAE